MLTKWIRRKVVKKMTTAQLRNELMRRGYSELVIDFAENNDKFRFHCIGVREEIE